MMELSFKFPKIWRKEGKRRITLAGWSRGQVRVLVWGDHRAGEGPCLGDQGADEGPCPGGSKLLCPHGL